MSESRKHMDLVDQIYAWIKEALPGQYKMFVEKDSPETTQSNMVYGYKPDVYYEFDSQLYIGEAKTINDFERFHSKQQYEAYLKKCVQFEGKACLVIGIPWQLQSTAKNYFRRYKLINHIDVPILIITDMNRVYRI